MTDAIHFGILLSSLASIGTGLWMIYPPAMFVGEGMILLALVWSARRAVKDRHAQRTRTRDE